MLQYTVHPPPLSFSKKSSQSSTFKFLSNDPAKNDLHSRRSALTQKRPATTVDSKQVDRMPPPSLSLSTSFSSLSSPSFSSTSLPQPVPRSAHLSSRPDSLMGEVSPVYSSKQSGHNSQAEDVLSQGDIIGQGISLQGEDIRLVHSVQGSDAAAEFEVVRKLGNGSYAVVYLVREVLSRAVLSEDDHVYPGGRLELEDAFSSAAPAEYGRNFAVKLLSKANLDEEDLAAQLAEATIHQSLPTHPNIVTLHRTFETPSFLLLLLEYVPGEDLFYFLEQSRDHYDADPSGSDSGLSRTPPTPGILSSLHPSQLLSHTRLRLIASMFSQMCEAVAVCHSHSVFHRDIKPENFIVTDGWVDNADGTRERKVVVKLTDFGLSTTDVDSSDMDCGSAPYMSFECRNNVAPVYKPRAADVWSLGVVLINMLYHCNPWADTAAGDCSSFDMYLANPINFFMQRFTGMTLPVAEFLASNVFCLIKDPTDDSQRIGAREFGAWVRDLPALLGHPPQPPPLHIRTHSRVSSTASITTGHPLAAIPHSRRPSSRASLAAGSPRRPPISLSRGLSGASPFMPPLELEVPPEGQLPSVPDQEDEEDLEENPRSTSHRSTSTTKRRKRGARKGKGAAAAAAAAAEHEQTSEILANASQSLVRELSRAPKTPTNTTAPASPFTPPPAIPKKTSKWKLSFGKSSGTAAATNPEPARSPSGSSGSSRQISSTAMNVSNLIMGLSPAMPPPASDDRGRAPGKARSPERIQQWASGVDGPDAGASASERRGASPTSTRSGRPLASSASSMASSKSNWRTSMSSTNTSTSGFTRYSNPSVRSVSTYATSISSASSSNWRSKAGGATSPTPSQTPSWMTPRQPGMPPPNIKLMNGVPWELSGAPRQLHQKGDDIFGQPPPRKQRQRKPKAPPPALPSQLEPITERPPQVRRDAATSTTDLTSSPSPSPREGEAPRVPEAKINALAKMLTAFRR